MGWRSGQNTMNSHGVGGALGRCVETALSMVSPRRKGDPDGRFPDRSRECRQSASFLESRHGHGRSRCGCFDRHGLGSTTSRAGAAGRSYGHVGQDRPKSARARHGHKLGRCAELRPGRALRRRALHRHLGNLRKRRGAKRRSARSSNGPRCGRTSTSSPRTAEARSGGPQAFTRYETRLNASLERLRTDYVDCYYLHGVDGREIPLLRDPDVKAAFEKLKKVRQDQVLRPELPRPPGCPRSSRPPPSAAGSTRS